MIDDEKRSQIIQIYHNHGLDKELINTIIDSFPGAQIKDALQFLIMLPNLIPNGSNLPNNIKLQLAKLNVPPQITISKIINGYQIKPSIDTLHWDAPFQHEIIDSSGQRLATFNFFIGLNGELTINAIQGVNTKKVSTRLGYNAEEGLKQLTANLGENWRIFIVKKIILEAKKRGLKVIGKLPTLFLGQGSDYPRVLRQYLQTYLQAGIPIENINYDHVLEGRDPLFKFRTRVERNLKNKQERLEGKRPMQRTELKRKAKINARRPMA